MSERHLPAYYKLEVKPEPGDCFAIVVDGAIVKKGVPRKKVSAELKEYLDEEENNE